MKKERCEKIKGYPRLKWSALQAGKKSGLPFIAEDGDFTPEFKTFWQTFEEDIYKWENNIRHKYIQWLPTILSLLALFIALCTLI